MELHSIKPAKGAVKAGKRIARGQGSGRGGTSTKGHKGAKSRAGYSRKKGFEGGQMPLQQRIPKRGFKNPFRVAYVSINIDRLEKISDKLGVNSIDLETLLSNGIVKKTEKVKILGSGELTKALTVSAHAVSESAKAAIEAKGGSINLV